MAVITRALFDQIFLALLSPSPEHHVTALLQLIDAIPAKLIDGNRFVSALKSAVVPEVLVADAVEFVKCAWQTQDFTSVEVMAAYFNGLGRSLEHTGVQAQSIQLYDAVIVDINKRIDELETSLEENDAKVESLLRENDDLRRALTDFEREHNSNAQKCRKLERELQGAEEDIRGYKLEISTFSELFELSEESCADLERNLKEKTEKLTQMKKKLKQTEQQLSANVAYEDQVSEEVRAKTLRDIRKAKIDNYYYKEEEESYDSEEESDEESESETDEEDDESEEQPAQKSFSWTNALRNLQSHFTGGSSDSSKSEIHHL